MKAIDLDAEPFELNPLVEADAIRERDTHDLMGMLKDYADAYGWANVVSVLAQVMREDEALDARVAAEERR